MADDRSAPVLRRRTVLAGTVWAVPAIAAVGASPALAASGTPVVSVTTPNMRTVAAGDTPVTVSVADSTGQPFSGSVSLTGSGGSTFSPLAPVLQNGTATATMTTTNAWATPGSSLTVTATFNGTSSTVSVTVLGANAVAWGGNGEDPYGVYGSGLGANGTAGTGQAATTATPPAQLEQTFPSPIVALTGTQRFSYALLQDGTVWAVGDNGSGQLGDGTTTSRSSWAVVPGLAGVTQISRGTNCGYALLTSGEIRSWGSNAAGQLGTGDRVDRATPVAVAGISGATQVVGSNMSCAYALLSTGEVRAWGANNFGCLGNNDTWDSDLPVAVHGLTGVVFLCAGDATGYALLDDGSVRAWGYGAQGRLGNGSDADSSVPVVVSGLTDAVEIAAARFAGYARLASGEVRSWGSQFGGELGTGIAADAHVPTPVAGLGDATGIWVVGHSAFAKRASGGFVGWGSNALSQLNDGTTTDRDTPVIVRDTAGVESLFSSPFGFTVFGLHSTA